MLKLIMLVMLMQGTLSQYAPGVMQRVIHTRQAGLTAHKLPADLSAYDGFVAVEDCSQVGKEVYLRPKGGEWELFLIADCSGHTATSQWMQRNNIIGEVDYETAVRWGTLHRGIKAEMAVMLEADLSN